MGVIHSVFLLLAMRLVASFFVLLLTGTACYLWVSISPRFFSRNAANMAAHVATGACRRADIAIVGGGLAGLAAALEAAALAPARAVLLLEKEPKLGGNSAKASSGINAALDAQDAPRFRDDTLASGGGLSLERSVATLVDQSPDAIAFLEQRGVDLSVLAQLGGHSAARTHRNAKGPNVGFAIVSALQKTIQDSADSSQSIEVLTSVAVDKVRYEDGKVVGLQITRTDKSGGVETETIDAPVVILATGADDAAAVDTVALIRASTQCCYVC